MPEDYAGQPAEMCVVVAAVTAVIGRCLWVLIRSNPADEKRGGQ